jgi:hypothetical protein
MNTLILCIVALDSLEPFFEHLSMFELVGGTKKAARISRRIQHIVFLVMFVWWWIPAMISGTSAMSRKKNLSRLCLCLSLPLLLVFIMQIKVEAVEDKAKFASASENVPASKAKFTIDCDAIQLHPMVNYLFSALRMLEGERK